MYAHCIFCNAHLGCNEALERFPVGRRLAYDAAKGRLWVVCPSCARWNLTPLEERWEAIEQAERLYRGTRLRASTDHVGLSRVADGTDLVRVGRPLLPEFAAWRYGRQLQARRIRRAVQTAPAVAVGVAGAIASLAAYVYVPHLLGAAGAAGVAGMAGAMYATDAVVDLLGRAETAARRATLGTPASVAARVPGDSGGIAGALVVRRGHLAESSLRRDPDGELVFDLRHDAGRVELRGGAARHAGALVSPALNLSGAGATVLDEVVRAILVRGGPESYLATIGRWIGKTTRPMPSPPAQWARDATIPERGLYGLTDVQRVALELVLHEEAERRATEGDLAELERAWRDAEEVAAVADALALPPGVESAWERLRAGVRPRS